MTDSIKINDESLKMLREYIMTDPEITEEQRQNDLSTIDDVMSGLESGEYFVIDRMSIIKAAAEKAQFRKKVKAKSRKVRRKVRENESTLNSSSLDAFDEQLMYLSDNEVRKYVDNMGITETYNETKRFDNEWN